MQESTEVGYGAYGGLGGYGGGYGGEFQHDFDSSEPLTAKQQDLGRTVYQFRGTENQGDYHGNLVFPLPEEPAE